MMVMAWPVQLPDLKRTEFVCGEDTAEHSRPLGSAGESLRGIHTSVSAKTDQQNATDLLNGNWC